MRIWQKPFAQFIAMTFTLAMLGRLVVEMRLPQVWAAPFAAVWILSFLIGTGFIAAGWQGVKDLLYGTALMWGAALGVVFLLIGLAGL